MIVPVILCGGSGRGLWPLSRELYPKQLMPLFGGRHTLLQITAMRLKEIFPSEDPIVVLNENHRFMAAVQLQEVGVTPRRIILEPQARNTAPAATVAALEAMGEVGADDPLLLILPSDHFMEDTAALGISIEQGIAFAEKGDIVSFGVQPASPETEYGYIGKGERITCHGPAAIDAHRVLCFVEKPAAEAAGSFIASGNYLWNSGIYLFRCSSFLNHLETLAPKTLEYASKAHSNATRDLDFLRLDARTFDLCPDCSIDHAVMEKISGSTVISLNTPWSDIGAWSHLHRVMEKDESGNVTIGDTVLMDVKGSYIHAGSRMIAAIGLENMVVVETNDALLISPMDRVHDVEKLVSKLKDEGREEAKVHRKVYRPWGAYECVDMGERFQVKRLTVSPGSQLSLQKHYHRAEHWVVVKGTARIEKNLEELYLTENQSTYVPLGTMHRLENPGKIPLEIIEVQTGGYLGEDDIVRVDDVYGRAEKKPDPK